MSEGLELRGTCRSVTDAMDLMPRGVLINLLRTARHCFQAESSLAARYQSTQVSRAIGQLCSEILPASHCIRHYRCLSCPLDSSGLRWPHQTRSFATTADEQNPTSLNPSPRSRLSSVLSLQAGALWQRHRNKVYTLTAIGATWLVWRITYLIGASFINVTQTMAEWGFMALAVSIVGISAQAARWYWGINPAAVYRQAMLRLNTNPAVLEVMGAPILGSDLRAYIITGGNLYLSRKAVFRPKISSRRLQMIFPLRGSERDGLVSLEVKRKQGQYRFKLLTVDVRPTTATVGLPTPRIYVEGSEAIYHRGSALGVLRDPFLKAVYVQKRISLDDELEEELEDLDTPPGEGIFSYVKRMFTGSSKPTPDSQQATREGVTGTGTAQVDFENQKKDTTNVKTNA